ncbi:histone acetyltransferase 1 [Choristoneura fumiferana]|uniref:histone acetyltransferase 1 n=1 Tax=Choristoneura fumiferana TaxID=7141 RepID=UPI003D15889E
MTSRLDRLFVLLESSTGPATRRAAARQLGEVQRAHPEELHRLLHRLTKHLRSPAWETRIAASQAVEAILSNVPEWHPSPYNGKKEEKLDCDGRLRCETFDIEKVLRHGAHLMGSEGNEYDLDEDALNAADINERLARQRQQLNARLGLDAASKLGMDLTAALYTNEDLCPAKPTTPIKIEIRMPVQELVPSSSKPLSSREINLAKRRARQAAFCKQKSRECEEPTPPPTPPAEPDRKKIKLEVDEFSLETSLAVPDCSGAWGESWSWPLEGWCGALQAALFGAAWEARHGAASALRELLRAPIAASAGITAGDTHQQVSDPGHRLTRAGAARCRRRCSARRGRRATGPPPRCASCCVRPSPPPPGITAGDTHQQGQRPRSPSNKGWGGALQAALFGAAWEARHGAASALRELLRAPIAASAGITAGDTHQQAALFGAAWEARHGAASALRELLRAPIAASAGITAGDTHQQVSDPGHRLTRAGGGALQAALFGAAWEARHGAASALRELLRLGRRAAGGAVRRGVGGAPRGRLRAARAAACAHRRLRRDNSRGHAPTGQRPRSPSNKGWGGALQAALFGAAWEARHGAASALRELLRAPIAASAGITAGDTHQQMENAHQEWLEDMALRLLCVLALDRFGDFVSDQVVAPVRETCAQTLGVTLAQMRAERVRGVAALLATLAQQRQWEARHGALLGFKYLLAARQDVACESGAIEHLIEGLSDGAEDVSAVAAGALAPAAGALAAARVSVLPAVVARLWQLLHDQDDLAAPANSYMALLASLMALPQAAKLLYPIDLADVLPRLWPYLDHSTSSVRKASLQTLRTLTRPLITVSLKSGNNGCSNQTTDGTNGDKDNAELKEVTNGVQYLMWTPELLQEAMRHIYQRILFEHVGDIQLIAVQVWENLLRYAPLGVVLVAACPLLATWLCLAMQPARLPIAPNLLLHPPPKERRTRTNSQSESVPPELRPNQKWFLGGSESLPACVRDKNVTRARCLAAEVLGYLSCYLVQPAPGIEYKAEDESPIDCFVKVVLVYLKSSSALQRLVASLVVSAWARRSQHHNLFPPNVLNTSETDNESGEDALSRLAPPALTITLHAALNQVLYYDEVALSCNKILQEARDLLAMMKHYKLPVDGEEFNNMLRLEQVIHMTAVTEAMVASMKSKRVAMTLEERRKNLQTAVNQCSNEQTILNISVQAALAGACASLNSLPEKLNPVVRPLMESIKKEIWEELQAHSAESLALLAARLVSREPSPNNKILQNLKTFLRCDPEYTPHVSLAENTEDSHGDSGSGDSGGEGKPELPAQGPIMDKYNGILTLWEQQRAAERVSPRRGRPPAAPAALAAVDDLLKNQEDENRKKLRVQRRGATLAFTSLARHFGDELPQRLPKLWEFITEPFATPMTESELDNPDVEASEELISRLQVFEAVCGALGAGAWQQVARGAAAGAALTRHGHTAARHMAARALAAMARRAPHAVITAVIHEVRARHGHTAARHMAARALAAMARRAPHAVITAVIHEVRARHGHTAARHMAARALAAMARRAPHAVITAVIHEVRARHGHTAARHMAARALAAMARRAPHAVITAVIHELVPSLKEASSVRVRCGAAEALARVVDAMQLHVVPYIALLVVPLLGRMSDHCEAVRVMSTRCFASLIQLMPLDGGVPEPDGLAPELRERRLADKQFLDQLFDPKTIKDYKIPVPMSAELRSYQQAGVNWLRFLHEYRLHGVLCDDMGLGKTLQSIAVVAGSHLARQGQRAPSLVVCPPTLTGHWVFEVNKFIPSKFLKPLQYVGPPVERERLRYQVKHYNLIVASYDIVRKDIGFFSGIKWNYCILDEGHVIKNGKTKAFKAIKQLVANHRLILSGTPIQNNVLELWSLFDFLMPGLLGTERQFTARYSRPILAARDPKATPPQLQAGALAVEALHRQVLPFLLRRVKEDVLKELPPKITQDYYCELSPLQRRLYEQFSRSHMPQPARQQVHVFQSLHYLQNVCNHPKLVLTAEHPETARVQQHLAQQRSSLDDIEHSAKLPALKQLLLDCGIGVTADASEGAGAVVSQHRALVFCQLKKMLDIVERDLLQKHLPTVSYLRLDGAVPPHQRHALVSRFNNDVSIDLLLLTTAVGGLGLNLTGADTVIFVEHAWNPMKDLQAMDRAHRLGQRRVVNVYRLITRATIEEKIMGLQKFKLLTANTVISSENAAMETMGTDQLLDLFQLSGDKQGASQPQPGPSAGPAGSGAQSVLETLPDLWDDRQYEEEYDMTHFIQGLNRINT